jgi:hypothetical protein
MKKTARRSLVLGMGFLAVAMLCSPREASAGRSPDRMLTAKHYGLDVSISRYWGCSRGGGGNSTSGSIALSIGAGRAKMTAKLSSSTYSYSRYRRHSSSRTSHSLDKRFSGDVDLKGDKMVVTLAPVDKKGASLKMSCGSAKQRVNSNGTSVEIDVMKCKPVGAWPRALMNATFKNGALLLGEISDGPKAKKLKLSQRGRYSSANLSWQ